MKVFLIICAVIALVDLIVVGSTLRISSRVSRTEEAKLEKMRVEESGNDG